MIGCDPELFIFNSETNKFVSSHDLVFGDKDNPFFIEDGATQVDGVSAEFNIFPASTPEEFSARINSVKGQMLGHIRTAAGNNNLHLVAEPVAYFDESYFKSLPATAKALGCQPDFNAYTGKPNTPPTTKEYFRTGSGHVHVGYDFDGADFFADVCNRVKQLDYSLFILSLLWDDNQKRRELYGMPGAFRPKPYGFEYRVLSNKWVEDDDLHKWVFNATTHLMKMYDEGVRIFKDTPPSLSFSKNFLKQVAKEMCSTYDIPSLPLKYVG